MTLFLLAAIRDNLPRRQGTPDQTAKPAPEPDMAALKLFISHSSRLRPVDADDDQARQNWQLLQNVCKVLKTEYDDRIEILVDYEGLHPGDDWERRLNEWLAECHAAIILFSRRAIDESNWVKKEAAILSWRAGREPDFKLFPVLLDQQTTPDDLESGFFGTLRITRTQCVPNAATAKEILRGIKKQLGEHPEILRGAGQTPFEQLLETVQSVIADKVKLVSLERLWQRLFPATVPPTTHAGYASSLARHLLNDGKMALQHFQDVLDNTLPHPDRECAKELLRWVRALWVDAGAAGLILAARSHGKCLALNGDLVERNEPQLGPPLPQFFTLQRYLERAWPGTARFRIIPVTDVSSAEAIQSEIRNTYRQGLSTLPNEHIDQRVRDDRWHVVVFVPTAALAGEAPDARLVDGLQKLQNHYRTPVFIFGVGAQMPDNLPDSVVPLRPDLELNVEEAQLFAERDALRLLNNIYG
ncbi:MAG TPA: toll/interleukin-1 receptor domain-containing protein [Accumulibacter sp.]|uniref:toll/interleukin-1 receptor domain-containing protein n=1 Tax=Accumulibacter sp. TaxID=2053492 RepID=UPI002BF884CB|nr:toll/interleukin-1 receptor domain-containing protein [Accumulibacter sp.]HRD90187.1 toll/interleukin-1 receptor domain-containing protein [Accumulibacter sp.]